MTLDAADFPRLRPAVNVSLTPELERLINDKVDAGSYQTASEVVREALRLLKLRDERRARVDYAMTSRRAFVAFR